MTGPRDSKYWTDRAEEARTRAANMVSNAGRITMLEIARMYDQMAEREVKLEAALEGARSRPD